MHRILKHKLLAGVTAAALLALGGGAYAATQSSTSPRQAFLNDVAKRLNVSPSQLDSALKGAFIDRLNAAVKAGLLTQAQANKIEQRIQSGKGFPFFGMGRHRFFHGFFGGPGAFGSGGPFGAAAGYLGLSTTKLMSDLASGKSLAQIANAQGKSVSGLEQSMTAALTSQLDKAVAEGRITKSQEQDLLNRLSQKIGMIVNRSAPRGFFAPRQFGGPAGAEVPPAGAYGPPSGAAMPPPGGFGGASGVAPGGPPGI